MHRKNLGDLENGVKADLIDLPKNGENRGGKRMIKKMNRNSGTAFQQQRILFKKHHKFKPLFLKLLPPRKKSICHSNVAFHRYQTFSEKKRANKLKKDTQK